MNTDSLHGNRFQHTHAAGMLGVLFLLAIAEFCVGIRPGYMIAVALGFFLILGRLASLAWAMVVLMAPLGLNLLGIDGYFAGLLGGRDYALSVSTTVLIGILCVAGLAKLPLRRLERWLPLFVLVAIGFGIATAIGINHHGVSQTLVGLRILLSPVAVLICLNALPVRQLWRLATVMAWLVLANGIAAAIEWIVGPATLVAWGMEDGWAVRTIDGTFRAPGLTQMNAELGMLSGAYLVGFAGLWLSGVVRPRGRLWLAAAAAGLVSLILSTSRSGVLMFAGGLLVAVLLDRNATKPGRQWARLGALGAIGILAAGFIAVGATGAASLVQRADIWWQLVRTQFTPLGSGIGSAGAATSSRISTGPQVFVDNYFLNIGLQFGMILLAALVLIALVMFVRLSARSARDRWAALDLALLGGLFISSCLIEAWEFAATMMCLAVFLTLGLRLRTPVAVPMPVLLPHRRRGRHEAPSRWATPTSARH